MTRSGIEANLMITPYTTVIDYGDHMICYHFSSLTGQTKFEEGLDQNREEINTSLTNRFRMEFAVADDVCDISLYRRTERRGFYLEYNDEKGRGVVGWQGQLAYNGQRVILKVSAEQLRTTTHE